MSAEAHLAVLRCRRAAARQPLAHLVEGAVHLVEGLVEALVGLVRVRVQARVKDRVRDRVRDRDRARAGITFLRTVPTRLAPRGGVCDACGCGCSPGRGRARGPPLPATLLPRLLRADCGVPPAVLEVPTEECGEPSAARLSSPPPG